MHWCKCKRVCWTFLMFQVHIMCCRMRARCRQDTHGMRTMGCVPVRLSFLFVSLYCYAFVFKHSFTGSKNTFTTLSGESEFINNMFLFRWQNPLFFLLFVCSLIFIWHLLLHFASSSMNLKRLTLTKDQQLIIWLHMLKLALYIEIHYAWVLNGNDILNSIMIIVTHKTKQ